MVYEPDQVSLPEAVARLAQDGIAEGKAKADICNALSDRKIVFRALYQGTDVGFRPVAGSGQWIAGEDIDIPSHLSPDDFDWERSRPVAPWRLREAQDFGAIGLDWGEWRHLTTHIERIALCRADVDKLKRTEPLVSGDGATSERNPRPGKVVVYCAPDEPDTPAGYHPEWISFDAGVRHVMRAAACDRGEAINGIIAACKDGAVAGRYGETHDAIEPASWARAAIRTGYRAELGGYVLIAIVPLPDEIPMPREMCGPTSPDDGVPRIDRGWSYPPVELRREDIERLWTAPSCSASRERSDEPETPYEKRFLAGRERRKSEREAANRHILANGPLSYPEAVKITGAALFGAHWIGPPSEDDKDVLDAGAPHSRFAEVHARNAERERQFSRVEAWLAKHGLIVEHKGHRLVLCAPLHVALAPHWESAALGEVKARIEALDPDRLHVPKIAWGDALNALESRGVADPGDALLREMQLGRVRAEAYYQRRDGKYVIGTLEPLSWRHVARYGDAGKSWMDGGVVWFDNERTDPATPTRARDIMLDRDELNRIWPEPVLQPDAPHFAGGLTWVDREYDERLREVPPPANGGTTKPKDRLVREAPPKQDAVNAWMQDRIKNWPADAAFPTEDDDLEAARAVLGAVRRQQIRIARSSAPAEWRKRGPRTIPPTNSA